MFEDGLDFFGLDPFTSVFVNNNGNITFSTAQSTFTPPVLTGATGNPIIAPFFADVDTTPGRRPAARRAGRSRGISTPRATSSP